jgi:hypothetical protein
MQVLHEKCAGLDVHKDTTAQARFAVELAAAFPTHVGLNRDELRRQAFDVCPA